MFLFFHLFLLCTALKLSSQWMLNSCCTLTMVSVSSIADQLCKQKLEDGWSSSEVGHIWHRQKNTKICWDKRRPLQTKERFLFFCLTILPYSNITRIMVIFFVKLIFLWLFFCFKFPCFIIISVVIVQMQYMEMLSMLFFII